MFSQRGTLCLIIPLLVVGMVSCGQTAPEPGNALTTAPNLADLPKNIDGYADIDVEQLKALLQDKDFTLINVHVPYEGEIEQTDLFIPYDQIASRLDQLPAKDAPIVLYCRSGSMSTEAAKVLAGLGYSNVVEVDGGFNAWKAAGYELLNKE